MAKLAMLKPRVATLDTSIAALLPPPVKVADRFYSSADWIALRNRVRREAGGRCQVFGCDRHGYIVDHKVEIKDGGAKLDRANVWLMCQPHHVEKTNRERAKRMRA